MGALRGDSAANISYFGIILSHCCLPFPHKIFTHFLRQTFVVVGTENIARKIALPEAENDPEITYIGRAIT